MKFEIKKTHTFNNTERTDKVVKYFDLQGGQINETFVGELDLPEQWNIGLIVGGSGTGKTSIVKDLFPDDYVMNHSYGNKSIIDEFPQGKDIDEIIKTLMSVGFSSPPSWLKPYDVLSMGEKMRVDLAYSLLLDKDMIVFDEFTSVVDRITAQYGSELISNKIRKDDKKFVGVSCHLDIIEWMNPDWVFNTDTMEFYIPEKKKSNTQLKSISQRIKTCGEFLESIII
jgi:ABC-type ATPase with predicted acetyltransferase domain